MHGVALAWDGSKVMTPRLLVLAVLALLTAPLALPAASAECVVPPPVKAALPTPTGTVVVSALDGSNNDGACVFSTVAPDGGVARLIIAGWAGACVWIYTSGGSSSHGCGSLHVVIILFSTAGGSGVDVRDVRACTDELPQPRLNGCYGIVP